MPRNKKIPPKEFARDYIELKAEGQSKEKIAEHFGISSRTLRRYLKDSDYVRAMSEVDVDPDLEEGDQGSEEQGEISPSEASDLEQEINKKIQKTQDKAIKEGIEEGQEKVDKILQTAYKINMRRIKKAIAEDNSLDKAGKIALDLLSVADRYNRRDEAIQQMLQINFNQGDRGISESMFFGSLRYGLEILDDQKAIEVAERVETYLRERNAIEVDGKVKERGIDGKR